jgi:SAM-dependent methyltransferase
MHFNSELLFKKYAKPYFKAGQTVLEIGPAGIPSAYSKLVGDPNINWHTIDFADTTYIAGKPDALTYRMENPYVFPIEDAQYDIVVSGQVMEHVQELWNWLLEIKRVLKPGGIIITISPVSWPYHEAPLDCWRIFPSGIEALAKFCELQIKHNLFESLEIIELQKLDKQVKTIPGVSYTYFNSLQKIKRIMMWNKIIRQIPFFRGFMEVPLEVAYDTLSILSKEK